jgi:hypothetical protein
MPMFSPSKVYLLRIWSEDEPHDKVWRFRLENPHTDEHWSFSSHEAFQRFLTQQIASNREQADRPNNK